MNVSLWKCLCGCHMVILDLHDPLQENNLHLNIAQLDKSPSVHRVPYSDVLQLGYG